MATLRLTGSVDEADLAQALADASLIESIPEALVIWFDDVNWIHSGALAMLCGWAQLLGQHRTRLSVRGEGRCISYVSRMGLFDHLDVDRNAGGKLPEAGRFLPLQPIADDSDAGNAVAAICDLMLRLFDDARSFVPALEWAVSEITDNIILHAKSPVPGFICAQSYPNGAPPRIDVAIYDAGRGIRASLQERTAYTSDAEAVRHAIQRGVTRDSEVGQGNGLAGAVEILRCNGGTLRLWTGDVRLMAEAGGDPRYLHIPRIHGTGAVLSFRTDNPVNLQQTWIGAEHEWSYLDAEAVRVAESGGLRVADECVSFGSRQPAKLLRRKIVALLPDMDVPLALDFTGVVSASSSFLDELLGRLVKELGTARFRDAVSVVGMDPMLRNMAEVVIRQRQVGLNPEE